MDKILIKKHDSHRILLTETIPYEVPLNFSNIGFYNYIKNNKKKNNIIDDMLLINKSSLIPYNYKITKNERNSRIISIPHPVAQYEIGELIHNNAEFITYLCSKSNFSIRKPVSVASYFYESSPFDIYSNSDLKDNDVVQISNENLESTSESKFSSSYFAYDGYTLLYKFFSSLKFQSIEKKFSYSLKFDIVKCFNSIYTHSISWAIKGKKYSKENIASLSFDDKFDTIIRKMNDNETNGIIIGPEFSRIFAEIILQSIDIKTELALLNLGYKNKVDYTVKRYVDDYFIFTKNEAIANLIYKVFVDELAQYKLYVNESKEQRDHRPFITPLSIAKTQVLEAINDFFKSIKRSKEHLERKERASIPSIDYIYKPYTRSNTLITKFKSIIKQHNTNYDCFSGLVMSILRARLQKINNEIKFIKDLKNYSSTYRNFLIFNMDFICFLFSMNIKSRTSHLMSQLVVIIGEITSKLEKHDQDEIIKKIKDEANILISLAISESRPRIEFVNFIISLRSVFGTDIIDDKVIIQFYNFDEKNNFRCDLDYFDMCTCLYLLCNDNTNHHIRDSIYDNLYIKLDDCNTPRNASDLIHSILDLGTFPYIATEKFKKSLSIYLSKTYGTNPDPASINELFNKIKSHKQFFIDWNKSINIKKLLQKKEMQRGYDS